MTFMTLSLQDMANKVKLDGPEEAEKYILDMVLSISS
jgi:COP9 signalosome complex subunit 3